MEKKYKVVGTAVTFGHFIEEPVKRLEAIGCEVILNPFGRPFTQKEFTEIAGDADAVIVGNDQVDAAVIEGLKKVKVIAKHGVGVDGIDCEAAMCAGIKVTNAPGTNKEEVADSAMGFLLLMARDLPKMSQETKRGDWNKYPTHSLFGKKVGIIGAGNIGTAFVRRAMGFGLDVLVCDPIERSEVKALGAAYVDFETVIHSADYLSIHCPLNDTTRNMLTASSFAKMKTGVFIVNTARSQILDLDDLFEAIGVGKVAGYATDVFDKEPPEPHQLYALDNVYLTPHVAGTTYDSNRRMGNTAVDDVIAVLQGQLPPNLIV